MRVGSAEALEYLAELDKRHEQMKRVSAAWRNYCAMENSRYRIRKAIAELAASLNTVQAPMQLPNFTAHQEKQPYYRRHAKGWNK